MSPPDTSRPLSAEFEQGDGRVWLDCAHQGPLPACARAAAERALDHKAAPSRIADAAFDVEAMPFDALVSCGFKWLCGPYATGFAWIAPELREMLDNNQAYWLAHLEGGLERMLDYTLREDLGAAAFDVFCTANFLNFMPWTASVELIAELGVDRVAEHDQSLVSRLAGGLPEAYEVLSPAEGPARSTLVFVTHRDASRNPAVHAALGEVGVDVALREGSLRLSPHLYNADADVDRALDVLATAA